MTLRKSNSPRLSVMAIILSTALVLSGCATTGSDEPDDPSAPPTLTIATSFAIDDIDPLANGFWGPEFGYVELLMRPERDGNPSPWVLSDLTAVDDTSWKLTLNEGVRFQNGRDLDGAALAQLLTYTAKNNEGFATASAFESATASSALTVVLTTAQPVPSMANVLADEANVPVFDVDAYEKFLAAKAAPPALLDAGLYTAPYVMKSLNPETAQLDPNPTYWDGTPALSSLQIRFVPEATARVQAVQAGEADLALYMPTSVAQSLDGDESAFFVTGPPSGSTFAFQLNVTSSAYQDVRVRRAVYAAVDYKALADDVLNGLAEVATGYYSPSVPYSVDTQVTDLALAADLLDQSGWKVGADGVRTKGGKKLTLRLLSYPQQPDSDTIAVALQAQLAEVGIAVQVSQVEDINAEQEGGTWDGAIVGDSLSSFSLSPVDGLLSSLRTGGADNYQGVSDPTLDGLIDKLRVTFDESTRVQLLEQIQQRIADQGLWAATVMRLPAVVTSFAWKGYQPPIANLWVTASTAPSS